MKKFKCGAGPFLCWRLSGEWKLLGLQAEKGNCPPLLQEGFRVPDSEMGPMGREGEFRSLAFFSRLAVEQSCFYVRCWVWTGAARSQAVVWAGGYPRTPLPEVSRESLLGVLMGLKGHLD